MFYIQTLTQNKQIMKKLLLFFFTCLFASSGFAQSALRPADLVEEKKQTTSLQQLSLFEMETSPSNQSRSQFQNFAELQVQQSTLASIVNEEKEFIEFDLPVNSVETITLQLVKTDIYQGNSHVIEEPANTVRPVNIGAHYRGIIKGNDQAFASVSFFENEISGMVAGYKETNLVLGKIDNSSNHIVYSDDQLMQIFDSECGVQDDGIHYKEQDLQPNPLFETAALSDCVRLYIEVDYDIYQDKGSTQNVTNYITGMMNQVMTVYANENINTSLSPLYIWTQSSPYSGSSTSNLLSDFQSYRNSFDGDLGQLVSYQASGGIAAGFNGICASNTDDKQAFSSIYGTYSNYPTTSYTVFVVAHEFGHLFGSRHTHACVWNGNGTAIDSCAGYVEGSCGQPGNPSGGGTIMSYCINTSVGIDMTQGFGPQPGNVIRNRVANGNCLSGCDGGDPDPDPDPEDCVDGEFTLTITLDNYPEETSWTVTNSSGSTVASGGTYGNQSDGSTVTENFNLNDGDYTFTITDTYGDGICCSYGNGSYSLQSSDGTTVAQGGNFTSSDVTEFCVESSGGDSQAPSTPTNLSVTGTTETTVNLDWNNSSDNVGVAGYNVFMNGNNIGTVSNSSANITGLTEGTTYSFYVNAFDAAGNTSSASNTVNATTDSSTPNPVTYCSSGGNNSSYEWIDLVELNNLNNPTGNNGGYADFTNLTANLPYGSNTIYVSAGFSGSSYREHWSIWIDFNQDGSFSSTEEVVSGSSSSANRLSASFTVPTSAQSGTTRMRVQMKYGSGGGSCESFNYGEVEDYTVNIGASFNGTGFARSGEALSTESSAFKVYPNPARGGFTTIDVSDFRNGEYRIVGATGKVVQQGVFTGGRQEIQLNNLAKGMYVIEVMNDGRALKQKLVVQ